MTGPRGERGPRGDVGEPGPRGATGHGPARHWRVGIVAGLVLLAVAGGYGIRQAERQTDLQLYRSQIASCHRVNVTRREINRRAVAFRDVTAALSRLLIGERIELAEPAPSAEQKARQARAYAGALARVRAATFQDVTIPNCEAVIPKP